MKTWERKKNDIKSIWTLVIAFVLFSTCFSAVGQTAPINVVHTSQQTKPLPTEKGNVSMLSENFSGGFMPPAGWSMKNTTTDPNGHWKIETSRSHSPPNSASVCRGSIHGVLNEWLITKSLNFSSYANNTKTNKITLYFWYYTSVYAVLHSLINFSVSVSTDGGTNWIQKWTVKNNGSGFPNYKFCLNGIPIDLSKYRNNTNVMIGFQLYSNTEVENETQYFALDDILLQTTSKLNFTCSAGGPYNWWWYAQRKLIPMGVRFHGSVSPGYNPLLCRWSWDFGDGNTSIWQNPPHYYDWCGRYNVTLTVTFGKNVSISRTTVVIYENPPFDLMVSPSMFSLGGVRVNIRNSGFFNATNVSYTIKIFFLPFGLREKTIANGTLPNIGRQTTVTVKSKFFFGFGGIQIEIIADPENSAGNDSRFFGFKLGPIIFAIPQLPSSLHSEIRLNP